MCGIAGIVAFKELIDTSYINKMTDIVSYRGPDDEGALVVSEFKEATQFSRSDELNPAKRKGKVLLGHRRLSILDLSIDGHQPMTYADSELWITYNGELYNYVELKEELISSGYKFKTQTDTEVILVAYHKWGEECLRKFNGMWSFAIYDNRASKLFCAVDQSGIKPFYYFFNNNYFCFSSEIKQLFTLPFIKRKYKNELIANTFGFSFESDFKNQTIYEGINRLKAGEKLNINVNYGDKEIKSIKWHEYKTRPTNYTISLKDASDKFRELFYDSVKLRLRSDVPVGTALSGGIDSSLIVLTMDKILKDTGSDYIQKTFTSGSEKDSINEIPFAKHVLEKTNAKGYFVTPTSDGLIKDLDKLYYHLEIPYLSTTCYASWNVCKLSKAQNVIVTLDGQGADETLAGYATYMYPFYQMQYFKNFEYGNLFYNYKSIKIQPGHKFGYQLMNSIKNHIKDIRFVNFKYDISRLKRNKLFSKEFKESIADTIKKYPNKNKSEGDSFSRCIHKYFYESLPLLLDVADRTSMAHSVESRLPFLDYRLLNFIFSLPHNFKIRNGITKYILKKAYKDVLPNETLNRPKLGFNTAEKEWFDQKDESLKTTVLDNIDRLSNIFNVETVENIFERNNTIRNSQKLKWDILSLVTLSKVLKIEN